MPAIVVDQVDRAVERVRVVDEEPAGLVSEDAQRDRRVHLQEAFVVFEILGQLIRLAGFRAQGRKGKLPHLAGSLLLGAVDPQTRGIEGVDAHVVAIGGVDDRAVSISCESGTVSPSQK